MVVFAVAIIVIAPAPAPKSSTRSARYWFAGQTSISAMPRTIAPRSMRLGRVPRNAMRSAATSEPAPEAAIRKP
jgi:hypothetical protein